jgi:DNA (cytosine-5)-methyltransferase 1
MRYLSVCSGIEAATVAWHPIGWKPVAFSEIEKFPSAVLAHHYPHVPNLGDMTKFKDWPDADVDVLVGGTPCQSFSVAGLRKGLADPRGNLALTYLAIADRYRPKWIVWENVPGVLSSNGGRDFGAFLGGLAKLGYGFAYRVLDAQYVRVDGFGRAVPQRRRRVFVVGYLGDWRRAAAVLFERESLSWDSAPRRQAGQNVAPTISARPTGGGGLGADFDCDGGLIPSVSRPLLAKGNDSFDDTLQSYIASTGDVSHCLNAGGMGRQDYETETFVVGAMQGGGTPNGHGTAGINQQLVEAGYIIPVIEDAPAVAIQERAVCENPSAGPDGAGFRDDGAAYTLEARTVPQAVQSGWCVRRLTPRECERLQGFPDDYTAIPKAADGPRYKSLGNSMAGNVMRWLGYRIQLVENIKLQFSEAAE